VHKTFRAQSQGDPTKEGYYMAANDLRELFPVLENTDGSGAGITKVIEGQAVSSVSGGIPALVAKDSSGNLKFLTLDIQGRLPVTSNSAITPKRARGQLDNGNATSGVLLVTGAQIILTSGKIYTGDSMVVSCMRECLAQLIWNNNGVDNILEDILLGPGQYTVQVNLPGDSFTAGTGTQTLDLRARNTDRASAIRGSIVVTENA
jgi:hypothetical protein